jgi:hypothetical protein
VSWWPPLSDFSTLKMEAIRSSETSVDARSTQHHIPEDDILQYKKLFMRLPNISGYFYVMQHKSTSEKAV